MRKLKFERDEVTEFLQLLSEEQEFKPESVEFTTPGFCHYSNKDIYLES